MTGNEKSFQAARKLDLGSVFFSKKADVTSAALAAGGEKEPEEGLTATENIEKQTISAVAEAMSMHTMGPNTTVVKHKGERVGQMTRTTQEGKQKYIVAHDTKGEHPYAFSTKGGAKVGMAEMHVGDTVKKFAAPYDPLQLEASGTTEQ